MSAEKIVAVAGDMVTAYGWGVEACWQGLMSGRSAIKPLKRFDAAHLQSQQAALVRDIKPGSEDSLVMQMLKPLLTKAAGEIPSDAFPFLATTTGEIDYVERAVLENKDCADESRLVCLLEKISSLAGLNSKGMVVSSACASSNVAVAHAAAMIQAGQIESALIVACDCVSEFVFSGFSALLALDRGAAAPFDRDRKGLSLGEAACFILLMSESRAIRENRKVLGEICGWGMSNDASHMTGPSREAVGLRRAIHESLEKAGVPAGSVSAISAHGTGTQYNDAMEMEAFKRTLSGRKVPVYSVKGAIGHTLGASGLVEILIAFKTLSEKQIPPTVGLRETAEEASGWVDKQPVDINGNITLSTSSGFGGINAALILRTV